jgi:SAM-dependent methyltransferase
MSEGEIERRIAERDAADRRYNDALTRVDASLPHPAERSSPAVSVDVQIRPDRAVILPETTPDGSGWRGRLAQFVWRLVAPIFGRQQEFNAAVARDLHQIRDTLVRLTAAIPDQNAGHRVDLDAFVSFNSILVQYLQQITPFVDTRTRAIEASLDEVRMAAAAAQRAAFAAQRKLDGAPAFVAAAAPVVERTPDSLGVEYVGFEDLYRGRAEDIRDRQRDLAERFVGANDVVDIGCGRGEFLDLLRERGVSAVGIDANIEMVEVCRSRGLRAEHADALAYLTGLPDDSVGGLVALQVVEHLQPGYLVRVLAAAHAKMRPDAVLILETINASCWVAFFESYIRDITHVRPLHPDTLKFLVVAAGFERADVHFRSPVAESGRLQHAGVDGLAPPLKDVVQTLNANVDRLNERLFTHLDYAVVAAKGR